MASSDELGQPATPAAGSTLAQYRLVERLGAGGMGIVFRGVDFLVMELVDGQSLAQRIAGGSLPLDDVLSIADQIAAAQIFHELLDHRWYLSQQQGRDVPMEEVVASYVATILPLRPDEQAILGGVDGDTRDHTDQLPVVRE